MDPAEESAVCGAGADAARVVEAGGESRSCGNVASGPMRAELLALVDAAISALDAGATEVAKARLQVLAEAVRALSHGGGEMAFEAV